MCSRPASRRPESAASIRSIAGPMRWMASSRRSAAHLAASAFCSGERRRLPSSVPAAVGQVVVRLPLAVGVALLVRLPFGPQDGCRLGPRRTRLGRLVAGLHAKPVANVLGDLLIALVRGGVGATLRRVGLLGRVSTLDSLAPGAGQSRAHRHRPESTATAHHHPGKVRLSLLATDAEAVRFTPGRLPGPGGRAGLSRSRMPRGRETEAES